MNGAGLAAGGAAAGGGAATLLVYSQCKKKCPGETGSALSAVLGTTGLGGSLNDALQGGAFGKVADKPTEKIEFTPGDEDAQLKYIASKVCRTRCKVMSLMAGGAGAAAGGATAVAGSAAAGAARQRYNGSSYGSGYGSNPYGSSYSGSYGGRYGGGYGGGYGSTGSYPGSYGAMEFDEIAMVPALAFRDMLAQGVELPSPSRRRSTPHGDFLFPAPLDANSDSEAETHQGTPAARTRLSQRQLKIMSEFLDRPSHSRAGSKAGGGKLVIVQRSAKS